MLKSRPSKKAMIVSFLTVILIVILLLILEKTGVTDFFKKPTSENSSSSINYNPPTEEEKKETEEHKEDLSKDSDTKTTPQTQQNTGVSVIITSATPEAIYSYVDGILEDGGTCIATFTKTGSKTFEKSSKGFSNVSTTQCEPIFINVSDFPSTGEWEVVVKYSGTSQGSSEAVKLTI